MLGPSLLEPSYAHHFLPAAVLPDACALSCGLHELLLSLRKYNQCRLIECMWIGVTARFRQFDENLKLTPDQVEDGTTKHQGVCSCLNSHYFGGSSDTANGLVVGSWGKGTRVRPPRDVDLMFVLPVAVYKRFQTYVGNKQSALLQEVKGVLQAKYSTTDMRGDGQVVVVRFNTINVEVVPAFLLDNGQYWICNTNDGGSYKKADPVAETNQISAADQANNWNVRTLVRMLKAWQRECNVPLKSFHIELLVTEFVQQSPWRLYGYYFYDWLLRDFFKFLQGKEYAYLIVPGTYELMGIGNDWKSRCDSAYDRAIKACDYEHGDYVNLAGEEWKKIFGDQIPQNPLS